MEQLVWSVDDRKYQEKNEKSLILEGWAFQRDSQPLRFLLTDPAGEQLPMEEPRCQTGCGSRISGDIRDKAMRFYNKDPQCRSACKEA